MLNLIKNCAILILALLSIFTQVKCNNNTNEFTGVKDLRLISKTKIRVSEPSGLTITYDNNFFWAVGDDKNKIYKMDKKSNILKSFDVAGEDLEGIAVIDSITLAVVLERTREVVIVDTTGKEMNRYKIDVKGRLNEGLEGIAYDRINRTFYVLNEKRPGLLLKFDAAFKEIFRKDLKLAKDYSDIYFAEEDTSLWILSDESKRIMKTDLSGNKILEYRINVVQAEGLVVDYKNKRIFVVSDKKEELYEFELP